MDRYEIYAQFYDLEYGELADDLLMIQQFAARCGSPILELACGTGRVLLPLAREGYQVTGIDVSPAMLEAAQHKVKAEDLQDRVTLVQQDMRQLDLQDRFRLAFVAVNSFMHLLTTEDQLAALGLIWEHLNPGGLLLLDLFNPDLSRLLDLRGKVTLNQVIVEPETGHRLMRFSAEQVDLAQQTIRVTYILDRMGSEGHIQRTLFPFSMRYLFRYELELLLRQAEFEVEAIYGSYDLDDFCSESEKMIAIARRPG